MLAAFGLADAVVSTHAALREERRRAALDDRATHFEFQPTPPSEKSGDRHVGTKSPGGEGFNPRRPPRRAATSGTVDLDCP